MAVHTADGYHLGTVAQVWARTDSTAQDAHANPDGDSRVEVYHGVVVHRVVYVPARAIAAVAAGHVTLTMDAATVDEQAWGTEPAWIATAQTGGTRSHRTTWAGRPQCPRSSMRRGGAQPGGPRRVRPPPRATHYVGGLFQPTITRLPSAVCMPASIA